MYLMRLDDATEHWNKENWQRMHDLLAKYKVEPLFALIPNNEDPFLLQYPEDKDFWETIHSWINEGWTPGLHGFNHVMDSENGGINPVNHRSEFAGKSLELQCKKIRNGYRILKEKNIDPHAFIAPGHTFDENTLEALRRETDIRIISETVADDVYWSNGFYFIPQQSGRVRTLGFSFITYCYHPNTMCDEQFGELEAFLKEFSADFCTFENIPLKKRSLSVKDRAMRTAYFIRRRLLVKH